MRADPDLRRVQRWVQGFIVDPSRDETVRSAKRSAAERFVLPSKTLTPVERVGIYRTMYPLRMNEALRSDFPALRHFLGDAGFERLVAKYVKVHPSRSYTLSRLRDHLPTYILAARATPRSAFLHDLARLELAVCEVFDAPESPRLDLRVFAPARSGSPPGGWEHARFRLIEAFRLLTFRYPVDGYLQSVKDESPHPITARARSWLAVYRRDYTVWRLPLTKPAYLVLEALSRGATLGRAIREAGSDLQEPQVFKWFQRWVAEGLFASVRSR